MDFDKMLEESETAIKAYESYKDSISNIDMKELDSLISDSSYQRALDAIREYQNIDIDAKNYLIQMNDSLKSLKLDNLLKEYESIFNVTNKIKKIEQAPKEEKGRKVEEIVREFEDLKKKDKVKYIYHRINSEAQDKILEDEEFRNKFEENKDTKAVVFSLDIRRSTELMLKSREPSLFSKFINDLIKNIIIVIKKNYGIFDKFTGDGVLAFFPEFYSGDDALYYALISAIECHEIFQKVYNESKSCFSVILKNIGLGIGIDFGDVSLNIINNEYTVVGVPVVYACRMSNTEANTTLLNQPAYEIYKEKYQKVFNCIESEIEIKHEGSAIAYKLLEKNNDYEAEIPEWTEIA